MERSERGWITDDRAPREARKKIDPIFAVFDELGYESQWTMWMQQNNISDMKTAFTNDEVLKGETEKGIFSSNSRRHYLISLMQQAGMPAQFYVHSGALNRLFEPYCFGCGRKPDQPMNACGQCKLARYCSKTCQTNDWEKGFHKQACPKMFIDQQQS